MRRKAFLFPLILLWLGMYAHAQLWSGVLAPNRAVNWSGAGVSGGIPNRTTVCSTLSAGATASQISNAIASCPSGQVVFLNAGTYNLSSGISFGGKSNVILRGAGADQTFLVFTGSSNCFGFGSGICMGNNNNPHMPSPSTTTTWTGGYAKGTTTLTVGSTSGMAPGNILILDQLDDATDTGNIYVCASTACTGQGGDAFGRSGRSQQQLVKVVSVNSPTSVTISPGLYMPNWRTSQSPGISWANSNMSGNGIENLSLDFTSSGCTGFCGVTVMLYVSDSWVKGVRSVGGHRNHIWLYQSRGVTVRDSYFYGTQNAASQSYGVEGFSSADNLLENNIFQHIAGAITINGADSGSVYAYNFAIDDYYSVSPNWMIPSFIEHESGIAMDLFEGNDGLSLEGDNIHGTHHFTTGFRNYLYGDIWNNPAKTSNTGVMHFWAFNRFFNVIGNVLGRTNYYNTYEVDLAGGSTAIYSLGEADGESASPSDPLTISTLMRWGNYDTVNGASRFVAGEVPSGLSLYANPVPTSQALPASFYLSAKPNWWGTTAWPPIGPDVTAGNLSGVGGHANMIPARSCWTGVMRGCRIVLSE